MKYSGSFWPQDYILYYYGTGGGSAEGLLYFVSQC